jgi:carboxyl-terminal processing protease
MDMQGAEDNRFGYRSTTRDVRKILDDFSSQGVDGVVLDLRRNGGGSLIEAINLTGLFIDQGPVVQVMGSNKNPEQLRDTDPGMAWKGPLVVLVSKFSASASEILAGAIQDYRRGLVIGDRATHGKGTVQSLLDLGKQLIGGPAPPKLGALKITMQQFFRPNGDSTQLRGVLSDIVLPSVTTYMDIAESDLDHAIEFDQVEPAEFTKANMVDRQTIQMLRKRSKERIDASDAFAKAFKRIDLYCKQKARKRVTLNEEKFLAERAEVNAQAEERKEMEKQVDTENGIERDYYMDEVLLIMRDYVKALQGRDVAQVGY